MRALPAVALASVMILLSLGAATAHSPTTFGDNESLASAALVREPTKSWAIYSEIHTGGESAWMIRKDSPQLKAELNEMLARYPEGSSVPSTLLQKYLQNTRLAKKATSE